MDNKLYNMLNDFFENNEFESEKDRDEKIREFIMKYNAGLIQYEKTPLDRAYEILDKAYDAKSKATARKRAEEAYDMSNDCLDAIIFLADLESGPRKALEILEDPIKKEEEKLKKEGYFEKEDIGNFYLIFETRQYMRGLYAKAGKLAEMGRFGLAASLFEEIIRLNENDNLGARFNLMRIYALLEDEQKMLKVYNRYKFDDIYMLLPLLILYYKRGDQKETEKYLKKIDKNYKNFLRFFKVQCEAKNFDEAASILYDDDGLMDIVDIMDELQFVFITMAEFDYEIYEMGIKLGLIERNIETKKKATATKTKTKKKSTATKKGTTKKKK